MENMASSLLKCNLCPRNCGVNRINSAQGFCKAGANPKLALVRSHLWEEPPISGTQGSGTLFFSHCNLGCVFCQNHEISHGGYGVEITLDRLVEIFLEQQARGVHNINLVSPTHFIPQIATALIQAKREGLTIPIVYNTNGYESLEGLCLLDGLIDIYLPDFKYWDDTLGETYSRISHYREFATTAILEMRRQVGEDVFIAGLMKKGLIIRHLVLPSHYRDSFLILDWIKEHLGDTTYVSLLNQYTPMYLARQIKPLSRRLTTFEYEKVTDYFLEIGLTLGFSQKRSAANQDYTPIFDLTGVETAPRSSGRGTNPLRSSEVAKPNETQRHH